MSYKVVPVTLAQRNNNGLRHFDHQTVAQKLEQSLQHDLPADTQLLGHYAIDAPDQESTNPNELIPGVHFIFSVPDAQIE